MVGTSIVVQLTSAARVATAVAEFLIGAMSMTTTPEADTTVATPAADDMVLELDSSVGPLQVTVNVRGPEELEIHGGPAVRFEVRPAGNPRHATYTIDGNPYGGEIHVTLDGDKCGGLLYRAGVHGPMVHDGPEAAVCAATYAAVLPHATRIAEFVTARATVLVTQSRDFWAAEVVRLQGELAQAEHYVARATRALRYSGVGAEVNTGT